MTAGDNFANQLAAQLMISPHAISEAVRRGLVSFKNHRGVPCWRFGDSRNGCFRRLDGQPLEIKGRRVKAEAETRGEAWHGFIGLDDVVANDRREILLIIEGSKDALAALHFADAEGRLSSVGIAVALGAGVNLRASDLEKFCRRRVRIFGDADATGQQAVSRIANQLLPVAGEVQIFNLADLHCQERSFVNDLFDLSRIDYDDFEANRDVWSITDLDSNGERVKIITDKHQSFPPPFSHVSPESHGFPVYPVSSSRELEKQLEKLAVRNACTERDTARARRWQLARDLIAVEKKISGKLSPDELMRTFDKWYKASAPYLDPKKSRDNYLAAFLAELGKVRVPTGEGESLKKALKRVSALSIKGLPEISGMPEAHESWRRVVALHRELARGSANGIYFLSCRDAAKAHHCLKKDSAWNINHALASRLGVIEFVRVGDVRLGGKASEFRYILPL